MNVLARSSLWRLAKDESKQVDEPNGSIEQDIRVQDATGNLHQNVVHKSTNFMVVNSPNQNQFEHFVQTLNSDNANVSRMERKIEKMESQIATLVEQNNQILAKVKRISDKFQTGLPKTEFPIKTIEELSEIEAKVTENYDKYVDLFRTILAPEGVKKHMSRILSTSILMSMNYSGTGSKTGLNSYVNLNKCIYDSQKRDGYTFADYVQDVRRAFAKMKNKVYKAKTFAKQALRAEKKEECEKDLKKLVLPGSS
ncbi:uncharacterized protein LOC26535929 isoform X1 [Drosophila yakuba]|uniref:Uncharacterized protein, isoform A n=1 Tax=Drosophila yakuba TaxID=7245 RepID=A0A0R1EAT6_DROYA|nr:uncharacterized protein LOC26535929 isoform X1 [Drosophila yakuba]XP_015046132.1 uncharacterized protein LOC26535929 isoform X1 [Drosophila yakuba]KRK06571.1 uncharacterized protein Dyak_GE28748, isoform A [Drosophila yakuba]KRK06572.1 uncharacterized protein Dyak_GE28748, isoform B [Drosophila yakuba]